MIYHTLGFEGLGGSRMCKYLTTLKKCLEQERVVPHLTQIIK